MGNWKLTRSQEPQALTEPVLREMRKVQEVVVATPEEAAALIEKASELSYEQRKGAIQLGEAFLASQDRRRTEPESEDLDDENADNEEPLSSPRDDNVRHHDRRLFPGTVHREG